MKEVGRAGAYYFSASGTLNYALCRRGAGICPGITGGKKKKENPRTRVDTRQQHTTGTKRCTDLQPCTAAVQQ